MQVTNVTPLSTTTPLPVALVAAVGTGVTAARTDHVHVDASPLDGIQVAFRAGRKLLGQFVTDASITWEGLTNSDYFPVALGFGWAGTSGIAWTQTQSSGNDSYASFVGNGNGSAVLIGSARTGNYSSALTYVTAPDKSPRMLLRWLPGASSANLLTTMSGFSASTVGATANGAYLRANTTGNLFFVTRQGATETTTDLGARPTALTSYEIETTDAGVTWTCRNDTTAAVVATHITNVPTASTGCGYFTFGMQTGVTGPTLFGLNYMRIDGGFTP